MVLFWLVVALLIFAAAMYVLLPLQREDKHSVRTLTDANVVVYRGLLNDLVSDFRDRLMTEDQFQREREELQLRLLADVPAPPRVSRREPSGSSDSLFVHAAAGTLSLLAVLLYLLLGAP